MYSPCSKYISDEKFTQPSLGIDVLPLFKVIKSNNKIIYNLSTQKKEYNVAAYKIITCTILKIHPPCLKFN